MKRRIIARCKTNKYKAFGNHTGSKWVDRGYNGLIVCEFYEFEVYEENHDLPSITGYGPNNDTLWNDAYIRFDLCVGGKVNGEYFYRDAGKPRDPNKKYISSSICISENVNFDHFFTTLREDNLEELLNNENETKRNS